MGLEFWKWRPYKVRSLVSNSIYAKKDRNGPPSANQVTSKDEPRRGHAVCTLWVHPPTSPCPALSAHAEPMSQGHCRKWHHEAESLMTDISAIGPKEWNTPSCWRVSYLCTLGQKLCLLHRATDVSIGKYEIYRKCTEIYNKIRKLGATPMCSDQVLASRLKHYQ